MAEQKSSVLAAPLHGAASVLRRVRGAGTVGKAAQGTLDKVGAVSPRGRRLAVYTGAGVLGAAGVVEWPVALTGAAVAWLTQPRPGEAGRPARPEGGGMAEEPPHDITSAALRSAPETGTGGETPAGGAKASGGRVKGAKGAKGAKGDKGAKSVASGGPLGPTARPDRTTL
ncbi:hypothetical protein [Streptomyces sp. NPDC006739]|uniref:hypothetical protein n=1 Tax=Streptomyces sp. NPDC006739 TaxID=3364763 RepID=UPI00369CE347